jgi:hypothetical protein
VSAVEVVKRARERASELLLRSIKTSTDRELAFFHFLRAKCFCLGYCGLLSSVGSHFQGSFTSVFLLSSELESIMSLLMLIVDALVYPDIEKLVWEL